MKLIKLALLTATAAVAATAFIGASSAAAHPWIALCLKPELLECKTLAAHPLKGRLSVTQFGSGTFKAGFEIKCAEGEGQSNELESQKEGGAGEVKEFKSELASLNFKGCTGGCKKVTVRTPQTTSLSESNLLAPSWRLLSNNAKVNFSECTFGVECEFEGNINVAAQMNEAESFFEPENTEFKLIKGSSILCGSTAKWTVGMYTFTWVLDTPTFSSPHNVWPSLINGLTTTKSMELP